MVVGAARVTPPGCGQRAAARAAASVLCMLLVLVLMARPSAALGLEAEVSVVYRLRQAMLHVNPQWIMTFPGWRDRSQAHHCSWAGVKCNREGHLTHIRLPSPNAYAETDADRSSKLSAAASLSSCRGCSCGSEPGPSRDARRPSSANTSSSSSSANPLIPELAQLQRLEELALAFESPLPACIPSQWGRSGAFPRLTWMQLQGPSLPRPLPDIQPGAMPYLTTLHIQFVELCSSLPPSWGSSPDVLPALEDLNLQLQLTAPLPPQWAGGFKSLHSLQVYGLLPDTQRWDQLTTAAPRLPTTTALWVTQIRHSQEAVKGKPGLVLPAEWAAGFPNLNLLGLTNLGLTGSIPEAWAEGGFKHLTDLELSYNALSGTLPGQFLEGHPMLDWLQLDSNRFTGTLPSAWGVSQIRNLVLANNSLTGPAFPPSWLAPSSLPHIELLVLSGNAGIGGTLPANLTWPSLATLVLAGTQLEGTVPPSWCNAPFAKGLTAVVATNTAIQPKLPACANRSMQRMQLFASTSATAIHPAHRPPAAVAGLWPLWLLLLPAAGAVVWARRKHNHCREQHSTRHSFELDAQRLLSSPSFRSLSAQTADVECGGGTSTSSSAHAPGTALGPDTAAASGVSIPPGPSAAPASGQGSTPAQLQGRRARLAALLSVMSESRTEGMVALLPLQTLPEQLTHNIGSSCSGSGNGSGTLGGSGIDSSDTIVRHTSMRSNPAALQGAQLQLAPASGSGTSTTRLPTTAGGSFSSGPPSTMLLGAISSRQWALHTHSLELAVGELQFVMEPNNELVVLGDGSHAVVFLARLSGMPVAVKVYELAAGIESRGIWREASLMHACAHPHIVPLYGVAVKGQLILLAMKLMERGSLRRALQQDEARQQLRWHARGRQVAADVAEALTYLHGRSILHSDLKSSNVLLCQDYRGHIADLGVSQALGSTACTAVGCSSFYAAPEQLMGQRCTLAADIYSFGVLLVELTTQHLGVARGGWNLPRAPDDCPQSVVDLIQACLSADPHLRPTAAQALKCLQEEGCCSNVSACSGT